MAEEKSRRRVKQISAAYHAIHFTDIEEITSRPLPNSFLSSGKLRAIAEDKPYFSKLSHLSKSFFGSFRDSLMGSTSHRSARDARHSEGSTAVWINLLRLKLYHQSRNVWPGILSFSSPAMLTLSILAFYPNLQYEGVETPSELDMMYPVHQCLRGLVILLVFSMNFASLCSMISTQPYHLMVMHRQSEMNRCSPLTSYVVLWLAALPRAVLSSAIVAGAVCFVAPPPMSLVLFLSVTYVLICFHIFGECVGLAVVISAEPHAVGKDAMPESLRISSFIAADTINGPGNTLQCQRRREMRRVGHIAYRASVGAAVLMIMSKCRRIVF